MMTGDEAVSVCPFPLLHSDRRWIRSSADSSVAGDKVTSEVRARPNRARLYNAIMCLDRREPRWKMFTRFKASSE